MQEEEKEGMGECVSGLYLARQNVGIVLVLCLDGAHSGVRAHVDDVHAAISARDGEVAGGIIHDVALWGRDDPEGFRGFIAQIRLH